ncbi:DUF1989 domain-containing protein [Candidatus Poriferisocius sp.]|uniref:DUF1989 domain-containing protein n=1 Tax=Candidatus Poriferisocius sp. TaxID=3101276 RepID=UPI003B016E8D
MTSIIEEVLVPASQGRGIRVGRGQLLDIIDVEGHQVGDLVAFLEADPTEYLSPTHTVSCNASVKLKTGSQVFSNRRNPIFTIVRDDVEKHDIIVPCCDYQRYFRDYGLTDHRHCLGNLEQARGLLGVEYELHGEQAWNVFMHNRVIENGAVVTDPAAHGAGATISLEAHFDLVVLLSACPQDLTPCNNFDCTPMLMRVRDQ